MTRNSVKASRKSGRAFWKWLLGVTGIFLGVPVLLILLLIFSPAARDWTASRLLTDSIIRTRLADVPARTKPQPAQHSMVRMRDGTELNTQIFLPRGDGPWPVIVVRDPYSFSQYVSCKVWVRYGYGCVYQEVRGRGRSQGTWYPFINEKEDGLDLLSWILEQPWQNGRLALYGGSYLGVTQWAVAGDLPEEVRTFIPVVAHGDVYELAYRNGAFNAGIAGIWMHGQFQPVLRRLLRPDHWEKNIAGHFPAMGINSEEFGPSWTPYVDYLRNPDRDSPYWQSPEYVALRNAHRHVRVPVFMIGYANDFFLPGMIRTYHELPARDQSVFIIGPGNHGGSPDPETEGSYRADYRDALAWLDHHLRGEPLPGHLQPGLHVFVHGDASWRHLQTWSESIEPTLLHLDDMRVAGQCDGGQLSRGAPHAGPPAQFTYNPRNPVPTRGGPFQLISDAVAEQGQDICGREDVLSFASAPFDHGALINGSVRVRLSVSSSAEDTAFSVKLSEHFSDGRVYNIRDDISTLSMRNRATHRMDYSPGEMVEVVFDLTPILWQMQPGSKLRLDISSSSFPAFFPHPNQGGLWSEVAEPSVALQTLYAGAVEVPMEKGGPPDG